MDTVENPVVFRTEEEGVEYFNQRGIHIHHVTRGKRGVVFEACKVYPDGSLDYYEVEIKSDTKK